jgi:hypothetical protein
VSWSGPIDPAWVDSGERDARAASRRAALYFALCLVVAAAAGCLTTSPLDTDHLSSGTWWAATVGVLAVEVLGYWVIWPRGTFTLDRPRTPYSLLFGLAWGICQGLLFLSVARHLPAWAAWLALSVFQGCFHALWWDIRVAPAHNVPAWNLRKVLLAHVPNLATAMWWWSQWHDPLPFVLFQVVALVGSARAMRFPPPSYVSGPSGGPSTSISAPAAT